MNIAKFASELNSSWITTILPTVCMVCGRTCRREHSLCYPCELDLPRMGQCCNGCGLEYPPTALLANSCGECLLNPRPFSSCRNLFRYQPPINRLLAGFKFHCRFDVGCALSVLLAEHLQQIIRGVDKPDYLLPVPLHKNRLRKRGFNQALEISRVLSKHCDIPIAYDAVRKTRDTAAQTEMGSARARKSNLKRAFSVVDDSSLKSVKSIAIVDDVVTTMATVTALSHLLQSHGIRRISVWCLARACR